MRKWALALLVQTKKKYIDINLILDINYKCTYSDRLSYREIYVCTK